MAKRSAVSELNHDNWNEEDTPEDAGTFCKASPDVMQCRVIKSAKRRATGSQENVSTNFTLINDSIYGLRTQVFWDMMFCCWASSFPHFKGLYCLGVHKFFIA